MKTKLKSCMIGALAAALVAPFILSSVTFAYGPERPTYTNEAPADHAVFNSITNNAVIGDERDFVRIKEKDTEDMYSSELEIEAGKQYLVYIYYHNDASATYNDRAHGYAGVARDVRMASSFPLELKKGSRGVINGLIMSSNTDPKEVWDEAYVTAKEDLTLHYISGSARIYNKYKVNGSVLSMDLFTDNGVFIGLDQLNGVILGCDEYSGQVMYTLQAVADSKPDEPAPIDPTPDEPTPDKPIEPVVPDELPKTGPIEIILAIVVVGLIIAGVIYWNKTHKAVKRTIKKAKGRK